MLHLDDHNSSMRWILKFPFYRGEEGFDLSKVKLESGGVRIPALVCFDNKALIC